MLLEHTHYFPAYPKRQLSSQFWGISPSKSSDALFVLSMDVGAVF